MDPILLWGNIYDLCELGQIVQLLRGLDCSATKMVLGQKAAVRIKGCNAYKTYRA